MTVDEFSIAVVIAKNSQPVFCEAYGFADREKKIPNTLQTRFRIGSMNKMFTAVVVLQLVESGRVGLDDPVGKVPGTRPTKIRNDRSRILVIWP
jgi:CubicO group peptidase (beta-lactamase class C family)